MFPRLGLLAGHPNPSAELALVSLLPGQTPPRRSRDSAAWSPPGPPGGPFLPVTVAVFAGGLAEWPSWWSDPLPAAASAGQAARSLAELGKPGLGARGDGVRPTLGQPVRCAAQARELRRGAIRRACRRGAPPHEGSGAARGICPGTGRQVTCPADGGSPNRARGGGLARYEPRRPRQPSTMEGIWHWQRPGHGGYRR